MHELAAPAAHEERREGDVRAVEEALGLGGAAHEQEGDAEVVAGDAEGPEVLGDADAV